MASATSSPTNLAAWLDESGQPYTIRGAPVPSPGPDDVVIRVHAVAINPVDAGRQASGIMITTYPWIVGVDGAGTIHSIGNNIADLSPGDRVIAMGDEYLAAQSSHGMFQRYAAVGRKNVCKIPDQLSFDDACVLPLGVATACGMLFEKASSNLDWPTVDASVRAERQQKHQGEIIIVWGGSSSVGASAIQLVKLSGYRVISLASKHNFGLLRECGAEATFDYKDADAIDSVCKWVQDQKLKLAGVVCAINAPEVIGQCGQLAARLDGKKHVATALPRGPVPEPELGEGITASNCYAIVEEGLHAYVWKDWLPKALELGQLKCLPKADIVGHGLEQVDGACELMRKAVSGKKLVVSGI